MFDYIHIPDSIFLKPGEYIIFPDSTFYAASDTLLIIPDNIPYLTSIDQNKKSGAVYDSLFHWAEERPWINNLLRLLIIQNSETSEEKKKSVRSEDPFLKFSGKIIRKIRLAKLEVFGPGIYDTVYREETSLEKFLNSTHYKTRDKIILNNLLIDQGDEFDPYKISDNERILRNLPYIEDARITVIPVSENEVDLLIITKDQYSLGFGFSSSGLESGVFEIYNSNFVGIGHNLQANIFYDFNHSRPWGYMWLYSSENIFGSFIKGRISYKDAFDTKSFGLSANHELLTNETKYTYGLTNEITYTIENFDTSLSNYPLRYNYQDYWLGRSFIISGKRDRIIISARFMNNNIYERPEIEEHEYHRLQRFRLFLGSIAISRENFYKMYQIYNFGRTEDIPYGFLIEYTGGIENNEFFNAFYSGLEISYGNILPKHGYLYLKTGIGGFFDENTFNRGIFQIQGSYFSQLIPLRRFQLRQFINFNYTTGIRRFSDEFLSIGDRDGIRGLRSDSLRGTQRLTLGLETVAFSPFYLYGFRFVFYGFADLGFIGASTDAIFTRDLYSGLGLGIRIRNESLSFKTIQIRFGFYPLLPTDYSAPLFEISGEKYYRPARFNVYRPELIEFK